LQVVEAAAYFQARTAATIAPMLSSELLAILVCPKCHGKLEQNQEKSSLDCPACRLRYAVEGGIPVMLIDEAKSY
jgi:uncharacterized protein YbaR (Trm112 family)